MIVAKIATMRKLNKNDRMQADSLPEIRQALNSMAFHYTKGIRVGKRPATEGHVVNAAILFLMGMPEEERRSAVVRGLEAMVALMDLEDEPTQEELREILNLPPEAESPAGGAAGMSEVRLRPGEADLGSGAHLTEPVVPKRSPRKAKES